MRSTAGIVAGLLFVGLVANCGGDDSGSTGNKGGSSSEGGEGGSSTAGKGTGGSIITAGKTGVTAGEGGGPAPTGCTEDADCGATAKCVDTVCKNNDGEACETADDCQNNCIDSVCTPKLDDGADCTDDAECAHTCIDSVCAPVSDVGGDCDVDLGAGGAGGAGAGGAGTGGVSAGGAGGDSGLAPVADCKAPLQCFSGKCLAPDGEACTDNVDCVNTCVENVCQPKSTIDGACDDKSDCAVAALVCDETSAKCKLDLLQQCTDNGQCKSDRCICSNANCTVRTCKAATSSCLCKWSPADSTSCSVGSANLNAQVEDPQGCTGADNSYCNQGQCVPNTAGDCAPNCMVDSKGTADVADDTCGPGVPSGCNAGYHATVTTACAYNKTVCGGACRCDLN
jgi:hypothetical protein